MTFLRTVKNESKNEFEKDGNESDIDDSILYDQNGFDSDKNDEVYYDQVYARRMEKEWNTGSDDMLNNTAGDMEMARQLQAEERRMADQLQDEERREVSIP